MKELTISDIRPFVRFVHKFSAFEENVLENRLGYDHRLFYILSGSGVFSVGEESFKVESGLMVLIPSGTEYSIIFENGKIEALGINFDYSSDFRHISRPIFPIGKYNQEKRLENFSFSDYPQLNKYLKLYKMNIIEDKLFSILREFEQSFILSEQKLSALLLEVLTEVIRTHISEENNVRQADSKAEEILSFLRTNYSETITNEELSRRFGYHPNHINYLIKMKTGFLFISIS